MALKAVLFDLDDTLWRQLEPPDFTRIQTLQLEAVAPFFCAAPPHLNLQAVIAGFWQEWTAAFSACNRDPEWRELDSTGLVQTYFGANCGPVSRELASALWHAMDVPMVGFDIYEDTLSTLDAVRTHPLRTAVVTNRVNAKLANHLARFGIEVDALVSSATVGYRKPHQAVFEEALRLLDVSLDEAVVVGDSYELDILGAQRAGLRSVLKLNDRDDSPAWRVEHKIRHLAELLPLINRLEEGPSANVL